MSDPTWRHYCYAAGAVLLGIVLGEVYRAGYRKGLAAAREVASWTQDIDDALDAINALVAMDDPAEPLGMPEPPPLPPSVGVPERWRP